MFPFQGHFRNYSATFTNSNPLGDEKLSLLDELEIHELLRNVRLYKSELRRSASDSDPEDGILDFLANDRKDLYQVPDAVYDSRSLERSNVGAGELVDAEAEVAPECRPGQQPGQDECEVSSLRD